MERNRTDSTKMCEHVIIETECFLVCSKCAFVQDIFFTSTKDNIEKYPENKLVFDEHQHKDKIDFLKELKSRGIVNDIVYIDCVKYMKQWYIENIPFKKNHYAYALYLSAQKNNIPLSLKEISYYSQLSIKEICKIEKILNLDFKVSPCEYIAKYCSMLNLTFMDEKIIKSYLTSYYRTNNRNPSHIAAAVISLVFPSIEKKKIADLSWTSVNTIKKISHDLQVGKFK